MTIEKVNISIVDLVEKVFDMGCFFGAAKFDYSIGHTMNHNVNMLGIFLKKISPNFQVKEFNSSNSIKEVGIYLKELEEIIPKLLESDSKLPLFNVGMQFYTCLELNFLKNTGNLENLKYYSEAFKKKQESLKSEISCLDVPFSERKKVWIKIQTIINSCIEDTDSLNDKVKEARVYIALIYNNLNIPQSSNLKVIHSAIDKSRILSNESSVLSLVRKLDGLHQEHAFLILETRQNNKFLIFFIDFVGIPLLPGIKDGKIRIYSYENELSNKNLIFSCKKPMMDIRKSDRIASTSWNISTAVAEKFLENIQREKVNAPKFNILGNKSIFSASTRVLKSASTGHNCFTWAKEKIRNLNDPNITIIEDDLTSYIFSRTSSLLVDPQKRATFWYQKPLTIATMVGVGAIIGGLAVANKEKIYNSCTIQ